MTYSAVKVHFKDGITYGRGRGEGKGRNLCSSMGACNRCFTFVNRYMGSCMGGLTNERVSGWVGGGFNVNIMVLLTPNA